MLWSQGLCDNVVYRVFYRATGVIKNVLYEESEDYPPFNRYVDGWVRVKPQVLVVIPNKGVTDLEDQRVNLILVPYSAIIDIKSQTGVGQ